LYSSVLRLSVVSALVLLENWECFVLVDLYVSIDRDL
jgi:hypothetical protein